MVYKLVFPIVVILSLITTLETSSLGFIDTLLLKVASPEASMVYKLVFPIVVILSLITTLETSKTFVIVTLKNDTSLFKIESSIFFNSITLSSFKYKNLEVPLDNASRVNPVPPEKISSGVVSVKLFATTVSFTTILETSNLVFMDTLSLNVVTP